MKDRADIGEELCTYCSLDKKGIYGTPGGTQAGCEGSRCDEAYEEYLSQNCDEMISK